MAKDELAKMLAKNPQNPTLWFTRWCSSDEGEQLLKNNLKPKFKLICNSDLTGLTFKLITKKYKFFYFSILTQPFLPFLQPRVAVPAGQTTECRIIFDFDFFTLCWPHWSPSGGRCYKKKNKKKCAKKCFTNILDMTVVLPKCA